MAVYSPLPTHYILVLLQWQAEPSPLHAQSLQRHVKPLELYSSNAMVMAVYQITAFWKGYKPSRELRPEQFKCITLIQIVQFYITV